jgi:dienelactone hydrolase
MCLNQNHQLLGITSFLSVMLESPSGTPCQFVLLRGRCPLLLIVAFFLIGISQTTQAQTKLDALSRLDATVLDKDPAFIDRPGQGVDLLRDDLRKRLRAANERSRVAWQAVETVEQWESYRDACLQLLKQSLGEFPATPPPLDTRVTRRIEGDGFVVENTVFQSRPGFWITANVYVPLSSETGEDELARPGIIIGHSHHTSKEHGELQDMGMTWARRGAVVVVMDYLGHGERRQHPFAQQEDYAGSFQPIRQDYYFRYDLGIQLALIGDSLLGWMVWDLSRGIDYLWQRPDIDRQRIILLGSVAGGGEPVATVAAIDPRVSAAIPFNFGGPQPETRYPLPDDAEVSFNYAGSGSWESTRNQRLSAAGVGFQPWVVVGSLAPRPLGYAHEFAWDGPRDPVWKRLGRLYDFYERPDHLAAVHGHGLLSGRAPEASHCTHIGAVHRRMIHPILKQWFGIPVSSNDEYQNRLEASRLQAMTPEIAKELEPRQLVELLPRLADDRSASARQTYRSMDPSDRRMALREAWSQILLPHQALEFTEATADGSEREETKGSAGKQAFDQPEIPRAALLQCDNFSVPDVDIERINLQVSGRLPVPLLFLKPSEVSEKVPVVVGVASEGKEGFLRHRGAELSELLDRGVAICLPDVRGTGETDPGRDRGWNGAATAHAATELMLGGTTLGVQLSDLQSVLAWVRQRTDVDVSRLAVWGDSFAPMNPPDAELRIPRRADQWPRQSEPGGALLALLAGLHDDDLAAVYAEGGLGEFRSLLTSPIVLIPFDVVIPGILTTGDVSDLAAGLAPTALCLTGLVDQFHQPVALGSASGDIMAAVQEAYRDSASAEALSISQQSSPSAWLAKWLVK